MSRHPEAHELGGRAALDALSEGRRREVLDHVEGCAACRERFCAADPTAVFALLALTPLPAMDLARLNRAVAQEIERTPQAPPLGWRRFAAMAASVLLAAVLLGPTLLDDDDGHDLARGGPAETSSPGAIADPAGPLPRILFPSPEPGIELISTPGDAQVVDMTAGDIQVVMIFDKELDI